MIWSCNLKKNYFYNFGNVVTIMHDKEQITLLNTKST